MSIDEIYKLVLYILNKNMQGNLTPANFNLSINQAQRSYQAWLLGLPQQYTPGRPVARIQLGQNSVIRQRLSPVIKKTNLVVSGNGTSTYPLDYIQADAMWTSSMSRVKYVQQNSLSFSLKSTISPVATNPIYLIEDTGFKFYPVTLATAILSYVGDAPAMVWGYTTDVNGRAVYSVGASVNPVWDSVAIFDIIARMLRMAGVNLQSNVVSQFAEEIKNNG